MKDDLINYAKDVSVRAGGLLLDMFNHRVNISSNTKGIKDIVTEADIEAEKLIKKSLENKYPNIPVISEESDFDKEHSSFKLGNYWIIDPLDGTRNFSIGNPNFVVSIGYVDSAMKLHGVIRYPILNQTFYTDSNYAYCDGVRLSVRSNISMEDAIVAFGDKREKDPSWDKVDILNSLRGKVAVLRMFGASALEKSWVASGQVDLYIGNSSSIFGATAGVALVRNAGGIALNLNGEDWKLGDVGIICGNKVLVNKVLPLLK